MESLKADLEQKLAGATDKGPFPRNRQGELDGGVEVPERSDCGRQSEAGGVDKDARADGLRICRRCARNTSSSRRKRPLLEAKLHDLKALKEQIIVVKNELHQKKVEELKRLDRAEFAMGNHGYLLKGGSWVVERTPGSYPLNQDLYRVQ